MNIYAPYLTQSESKAKQSKAKQSTNSLVTVFISLFLLCPQMCHANTRDGLVGWWKFDEASGNAVDSSWQGNTGTPTGTTIVANCKRSSCRSFNGSSDFVSMGASHYNFTTSTPFSGCAWIKTTGNSETIFSDWHYQASPGWTFSVGTAAGSRLAFALTSTSGATQRIAYGSTFVNDNKFYFARFTYDGSNTTAGINLYVNAVAESLTNYIDTDPGALVDSGFNIGKINGAVPQYFNGYIDDVRIYNRVLTTQEIKDLYGPGMMIRGNGTTIRGTGTKLNY